MDMLWENLMEFLLRGFGIAIEGSEGGTNVGFTVGFNVAYWVGLYVRF